MMEFRRRDNLYSDTVVPHRRRAKTIDKKFDDLRRQNQEQQVQQNRQENPENPVFAYITRGFDVSWKNLSTLAAVLLAIGWLVWIQKTAY
jgi:hypothetical protein